MFPLHILIGLVLQARAIVQETHNVAASGAASELDTQISESLEFCEGDAAPLNLLQMKAQKVKVTKTNAAPESASEHGGSQPGVTVGKEVISDVGGQSSLIALKGMELGRRFLPMAAMVAGLFGMLAIVVFGCRRRLSSKTLLTVDQSLPTASFLIKPFGQGSSMAADPVLPVSTAALFEDKIGVVSAPWDGAQEKSSKEKSAQELLTFIRSAFLQLQVPDEQAVKPPHS